MPTRSRPAAVGAWRGIVWAVVLAGLAALADALGVLDVKGGAAVAVAVAVAMLRAIEGLADDRRETRPVRRARKAAR